MFQRPMPQAAMNVHAAFVTKMICMNFVKNPSSVSTRELTWNFRNWERIALPFFKPDPARKPMRLQKNSHVFVQSQPPKTSNACAQ